VDLDHPYWVVLLLVVVVMLLRWMLNFAPHHHRVQKKESHVLALVVEWLLRVHVRCSWD
jgi:hypothetical protein